MSPDFFSPTKSLETTETETLKQRLYSGCHEDSEPACCDAPYATVEELKKLCLQSEGERLLHRIQSFKKAQSDKLSAYMSKGKKRVNLLPCAFYLLHGWHQAALENALALTEQSRKTEGGFYLRWNGKGIVINPGTHFLDYFHQQGLTVRDIDFIIASQNTAESSGDIPQIYALNAQLNRMSGESHIIHYYLNPAIYQNLYHILKPNTKQERNTVHELDLFGDSPEVEKVQLAQDIDLYYFLPHGNRSPSSLPLRFELKHESLQEHLSLRLAVVSKTAWNPLLSHHLGLCDVVIAGFGNTSEEDCNKQKHSEEELGYFGTFSLLEDIQPKLLITTEFGGREGDIRLEIADKLRREFSSLHPSAKPPVVLPGDLGLLVDLRNIEIQSSLTKQMLDPATATVIRPTHAFGPLYYLAPSHCLFPAKGQD